MIICPNFSNPDVAREFEELKQATSEAAAYHIWSLNNGNAIDKAPNGAESKLFLTLLEYYNGDRTKAIQAKAKTYGKSFLTWFGDWTRNYKPSDYKPSEGAKRVILEEFDKRGLYQMEINVLRDIIEENAEDLTFRDAKKIYDAIREFVILHDRMPSTENANELLNIAFGEPLDIVYFAEAVGEDVLFDLPLDETDAKIEFYQLQKKYPELKLEFRSVTLPTDNRNQLFKEFVSLVRDTECMQGLYDFMAYVNEYKNKFNSVSKVVDENGEPLVVYHGTRDNFPIFEVDKIRTGGGFWFTTQKGEYASSGSQIAAFLNMRTPYNVISDFDKKFGNEAFEKISQYIKDEEKYLRDLYTYNSNIRAFDIVPFPAYEILDNVDTNTNIEYPEEPTKPIKPLYDELAFKEAYRIMYGNDLFFTYTDRSPMYYRSRQDRLDFESRGFDGETDGFYYVVINPNQIKSIDNEGPTPYEGTFSRENDDIYYQILTDSEYSEMIEELELSRDSTDSFIYNFVTKVLKVKPNYKVDENSSDSVWYSYFNTNINPLYTNSERTEKLIRKIFGYNANIVFDDKQSLIKSINEELDHWVENLKNIIENPLDLSVYYKQRSLILLRIKNLRRYNKGKLSLNDIELQQVLDYIDNLNSNASKYSKLTESQRIGYEIVKLRKQLLSLEQQIQHSIFIRHSIIVSAKNRLVAINTIDNIQDLIKNRILLEYEAYQPKDDFINQKVLPFENLLKKIQKATLSNLLENRTDDLINLDQQTDITYDELYKIVTKNHHEFANLIELFRSANPDLKIKIGGDPERQFDGIVSGKFHPKTNTLTLYNGCDVYTIIHELAHSATFFGIMGKSEKSEEFSKKIEMFMNYIRKYISDNKLNPGLFSPLTLMGVSLPANVYGFTNESEFIAELYGNPSFLDLLDSIPPMNKKEFNSLLQEFIYTIIEFCNNLLGKNRIHKSALDLAKELGLISIKLQKDHIEDIYQLLRNINNNNFNDQLNNFLLLDLSNDNKQLLSVLKNLGEQLRKKCKGE